MPTIKTKKEMNLPELIEWGWKNIEQVEGKEFKSNVRDSFGKYSTVYFSVDGYGFKTDGISHKDTFTVETEEEITEDTVLDAVVIVRKQISPYDRESTHVCRKGNVSVNQVLSLQPNNSRFVYLEIHLMKNDRIDQLIWTKEKGLVE